MKKDNYLVRHSMKFYGSIPEYAIINDCYLSGIVLRSAIVSDIMSETHKKNNAKVIYMSQLLKRCSLIKEIKKTAWNLKN